jgi:hypothetical protein
MGSERDVWGVDYESARIGHCIKRLWQRYGLESDAQTIDLIEQMVRLGRCGIVQHAQDGHEGEVIIGGVAVRYVWDDYWGMEGAIRTFLPPMEGSIRPPAFVRQNHKRSSLVKEARKRRARLVLENGESQAIWGGMPAKRAHRGGPTSFGETG